MSQQLQTYTEREPNTLLEKYFGSIVINVELCLGCGCDPIAAIPLQIQINHDVKRFMRDTGSFDKKFKIISFKDNRCRDQHKNSFAEIEVLFYKMEVDSGSETK